VKNSIKGLNNKLVFLKSYIVFVFAYLSVVQFDKLQK
jgi:hypothetical protein